MAESPFVTALLRALPVLALLLAAVDTLLTRRDHPHRPVELALFGEAAFLWVVFGLLALVPARLTMGPLRRWSRAKQEDRAWGPAACALGFWMLVPVVAHGILDRFTAIGQDVSALFAPKPWALVLLACALLVALARVAAPRLSRLPGLPVAFGASFLALGVGALSPGRLGRTGPAPVAADASGRPNLLLLVWDTTRAQSLPLYGYERETTPQLAALAEQALVFEEARSVSCFTLTSHLSMLTGVYPSHHGARMTRMEYDHGRTPSIAKLLHEAGYRTGGFVGTGVLRAGTGIDDGFERYDDRVDPHVCDTRAWALVHDVQAVLAALVPALGNDGNPHWIQDYQRPGAEVLANARAWIEEQEDGRPWFCFVNLYDAHWPYLPTEAGRERFVRPYDGRIDGHMFRSDDYTHRPGVPEGSLLDDADKRHLTDLYEAEIWDLDLEVDAFLGALGGRLDGTAVLVTSDHGEAFGELGAWEHDDITELQVRVPFLLRLPPDAEAPVGAVGGKVSGVDVATTLLAVAGLAPPAHMTGADLSAGGTDAQRAILVEDRDKLRVDDVRVALYRGRWKLLRTGLGADAALELFDLEADPAAAHDVAAEHAEVVERLSAELRALRASWGGEEESWQDEGAITADALRALGYTGEGAEEAPADEEPVPER